MLTSDQVLFDVLRFSPDAMAIYDSPSLRIAFANDRMLSLWNFQGHAAGKLSIEVLPAAQQQTLLPILKTNWDKGTGHTTTKAMPTELWVDGRWETRYYDFEFKTLIDSKGDTFAILQTGRESVAPIEASKSEEPRLLREGTLYDATAHLPPNRTLVHAELAKHAAQLGVLDIDIIKNTMVWDERCRYLFGQEHAENYDTPLRFVNAVHADDKLRVVKSLVEAYEYSRTAGSFDLTFRTAAGSKGCAKQIHMLGLVYFNRENQASRFIATVRDVTESVHALDALQKREIELQQVNAELGTLNDELSALNKELAASNESLVHAERMTQSLNDELQSAFDRLKFHEDRMNLAIQSAELGTWTLDVLENKVFLDKRSKELYGYPTGDLIDYNELLHYLHADDINLVHRAVQHALDPKSGGLFDTQFRTIGATDGKLRWLHCKGRAYFNESNQPILFSGTARDITDVILAREKIDRFHSLISEKEKILQLIVDSAQIGTFTLNLINRSMELNIHARALFGFSDDEILLADAILEQTLPAYKPIAELAISEAIQRKQPCDYSCQVMHKKTGKARWLRTVGSGAQNPDGSTTMFYGVIIDITAQKEEEQRKTDFLSIASHELRSPLTSLSGYLQILTLKRKQLDEARLDAMIRNASRQSERMRVLIDSFLDIARVNEGKLQLRRKKFEIASFLMEIEKTLSEITTSHHFIFNDQTAGLSIVADRDKLEQVIINFVNNAIKYTPSNTVIRVTATCEKDSLEVRVADEGFGIAAADQARIFERFYRVDSPKNENVNGFGIGLFISKEIIHLHEGTIDLHSEEGKGTTFWFSIPIRNIPTTSG
ncbi:ATP-binding protein [Sphingobacterium griseoflavum]|uniref:histidine kinase n=1 Tax=Sphingobacterium griseoflavum TaxID=1474952 RepID=A0ABQ3I0J3_9SPHI|nr:ATP-binding protein [Sphingobacterium griseoflavum]GHE41861.1 hypothetical protein GCM10017764_26350 [Sphingobacterium griseoflavum]